jgi:serine/threonine-protein kinase PknG
MNTCMATPGCTGQVEDGYCSVCGLEPPDGQSAPIATENPVGAASPPMSEATPAWAAPATGTTYGSGSSGSGRSGSGGTRTGSTGATGSTGSTGSTRRGMLGVGLVEVPPVPAGDPAGAILKNPEVPERKRFCSVCGAPVGQSRGGRPGRTEGFCPKDGAPYSFTPKLSEGELVGGQYEVLGCLAHGGLGWVYLARDKNVSDRWVVLKGLLDSGDADAMMAAAAERAFLAEVEHPNIVKIYNFVQHPDAKTGQLVGYIVMEYVGGQALKDMLADLRKQDDGQVSLPLDQVLAYGLEVLRALGYLHGLDLLYCDFKPDNAIQSEEQLKLIDLGGVRRAADEDSPIFGTVGYQAPEIAEDGPSFSSDLYTVGRALAVMSFPFRGYTTTYAESLPPRADIPLLTWYESYDRLLRRATHREPARRFQSAGEMAEQLTGVLREVLSAQDGQPRPAASTLFGPEQHAAGTDVDVADRDGPVLPRLDPRAAAAALPAPLVYGSDPAAGFLAGLTARDPADLVAALSSASVSSPEVSLMLARARIGAGDLAAAGTLLDELGRESPGDWRVDWYRGVAELAAGRGAEAAGRFDALYDLSPGETAPKLALAFALELTGDDAAAAHCYEMVWRTDRTYVSAAFGLARVRLAGNDRPGAVDVLDSVPVISSHYVAAQLAAVAAAVRGRSLPDLAEPDLVAAGRRLEGLRLDAERRARLSAEVLDRALQWIQETRRPSSPATLLGVPMTEDATRRRLEELYRSLGRLVDGAAERHALIDLANVVRPKSVF